MTFDEWFDDRYPADKMGLPAMRIAFREVAEAAWEAKRKENFTELYLDTSDAVLATLTNDEVCDALNESSSLALHSGEKEEVFLSNIAKGGLKISDEDKYIVHICYVIKRYFELSSGEES